ncbi:MAG TPA: TonB-dependent receptor [Bryobacteraceae bacterium]|nr:TonB-dependent receptor [Bryobacteraceae bacterium]
MSRKQYFFVAVIAAFFFASVGLAQSTFGAITGTVKDPAGALVPGAQIEVANEGTGAIRRFTTSAAGVFNVPNLDVGGYKVRVSAKGFSTYERGGLNLTANQILNLNVDLSLGTATQVVEVQGASPAIATETTDIAGVMGHDSLEDLPLVGRHDGGTGGIYTYVTFNTGAAKVANSSTPIIQGTRSQVGILPTMDGIAVMAYPQGAGPVQPGIEDIQEVRVETAVAPAEFATAGNFQAVSKSGTNEYHGSAFWEYNGNALNARNFFSATVPFRVYNDFAASAGGPIKKNKLFFFMDYEGSREAATSTLVESVPLTAWRSGNFSSLSAPIKDPTTGQAFPNNQIPASRISPVSQAIQSYAYPLPNAGSAASVSNNWVANFPGNTGFTDYDGFDVRGDYNVTEHDIVFSRISWRKMPLTVAGVPTPLFRDQARYGESAVLSWNHTISPAAVNELRFGSTYHRNHYFANVTGSDLLKQFGIQGISTSGVRTAPYFNITGVTPWNPSTNSFTYQDNPETTLEALDNLSWNHGRHFMKYGFDFIRDIYGGNNIGPLVYGEYDFSGTYTGSGYGDFLLGIPQTTELQIPPPDRALRGNVWAMYAQDQFKVNSSLTLNFGFRWELEQPYTDKHGLLYNFNPATGGLVIPDGAQHYINPLYPKNIPITTASQAGFPANSLINANFKRGFEPRIGFAYKLFNNDKTVLRGGYGIYSNLIYSQIARSPLSGGPYSGSVTYFNAINNGTPLFSFPDPFLSSGTASIQNVSGANPHLKLPYTEQWNLSLERQLGSFGLRASYVGTRSVDLPYNRNLNEPVPSTTSFTTALYPNQLYNNIVYTDSGGTDRYNALELAAQKKYGQNLTITSGFTWAKDLTDTQDSGGGGSNYGGQLLQNQFCRVCEKSNNELVLPHRFFAYAVYALPVGRGQRFLSNSNGIVQAILGGWRTSWTATLQDGPYFTPTFSGSDPSNTGVIGGVPDRIGNGNLPSGQRTLNHWFDTSAFVVPGCPTTNPVCSNPANVGRFGNSGWNYLTGPATKNLDIGLAKDFKVTERFLLRFNMTMADALNHPNFTIPAANISSPGTVGVISSATSAALVEPVSRQINFSLRLNF